jgi:hypothetical protein
MMGDSRYEDMNARNYATVLMHKNDQENSSSGRFPVSKKYIWNSGL